jgi:UDP-glucose 4-epimerase
MSKVLVTGGAGYIGSHVVRRLSEQGYSPIVIDDLSTGHRAATHDLARLVEADFADETVLDELLGAGCDFIVHLAASCEVGESMAEPAAYYRNNLVRSLTLLDAACRHGITGLVFSSSAAVYGEPQRLPIDEDHPCHPTNPYGETKLAFGRALEWPRRAHGIRYVALRYFNAAGAHPDGDLGEDHAVESHLIPRLLRGMLDGGASVPIFGDDYPTRDGTCVRDYVHVVDLAEAHVLALDALRAGRTTPAALNLGNGAGFTVREVIETAQRVTGSRARVERAPRRPGDPATLVASARRAEQELGWRPRFATLDSIVGSAWEWHRRHPQGFAER